MMNDLDNIKIKRNLNALVEFSRIINSSTDLDFIVNNILLTCMGKFLATKGLFSLNIDGIFKIQAAKGIPAGLVKQFSQNGFTEDMFDNKDLKAIFGLGELCVTEKIMASGK